MATKMSDDAATVLRNCVRVSSAVESTVHVHTLFTIYTT